MKKQIKNAVDILGDEVTKLYKLLPLYLSTSILDILGIGIIVIFANLLIAPESFLEIPYINLKIEKNFQSSILISLIICIFFIFRTFIVYYINRLMLKTTLDLGTEIRSKLLSEFFNWNFNDYRRSTQAELTQRVFFMVGKFIFSFIQPLIKILAELFTLTLIIIFIFSLNPILFPILSLILIFFGICFDRFAKTKLIQQGKIENSASTKVISTLKDSYEGWRFLTQVKKTNFFLSKFIFELKNLAYARLNNQSFLFSIRILLELCIVICFSLVIIISYLMGLSFEQMVNSLLIIVVASIRIIPSANLIISNLGRIRNAEDSVAKLSLFNKKNYNNFNENVDISIENKNEFSSILIKELKLKNSKDSKEIKLKDILITKGDIVGLIGPSGSGKSTILNFLSGFIKGDKEKIILNEQAASANKIKKYFNNISVLLTQDPFLFNDTILSNITLSKKVSNELKEKCKNALILSRGWEFVKLLDDQINTFLVDNGQNLSGGQKQRIALARVLFSKKDLLLLDEPTSALDGELSLNFVEDLKNILNGKTAIIATHDLELLKFCNKTINYNESSNFFEMSLNNE